MTRINLYLLILLAATAQSGAAQDAEKGRITALENAWNQALVLKDFRAIESLMAAELIYIEYDGSVRNKASYLESLRTTNVHAEHAATEAMQVQVYGHSALVTGIYKESGTENGKPFARRERFVDTWINRDGTWLCVASQSTLITH